MPLECGLRELTKYREALNSSKCFSVATEQIDGSWIKTRGSETVDGNGLKEIEEKKSTTTQRKSAFGALSLVKGGPWLVKHRRVFSTQEWTWSTQRNVLCLWFCNYITEVAFAVPLLLSLSNSPSLHPIFTNLCPRKGCPTLFSSPSNVSSTNSSDATLSKEKKPTLCQVSQ